MLAVVVNEDNAGLLQGSAPRKHRQHLRVAAAPLELLDGGSAGLRPC